MTITNINVDITDLNTNAALSLIKSDLLMFLIYFNKFRVAKIKVFKIFIIKKNT